MNAVTRDYSTRRRDNLALTDLLAEYWRRSLFSDIKQWPPASPDLAAIYRDRDGTVTGTSACLATMAATTMTEASINSTFNYVKATAFNATAFLVPRPKDLLYLFPRIAARAGTFVTDDLPGAFENIFAAQFGGRLLEQATAGDGGMAASPAVAAANILAGAGGNEQAVAEGGFFTFFQSFGLQQLRTFGGLFSYLTSKWALGCFIVSVVLKRTAIYASTRRNLRLNWQVRAALRILPILVLLSLCRSLVQSMKCQMSPDFSLMRYGELDKHTKLDFSGEGGLLYQITSLVLFYETDAESCSAVDMISTHEKPIDFPNGSMAMLWPSFQAFSLAQFIETIVSSLQNISPATETGMTLFEHSLAFAEAEAMVTHQLGLGWTSSAHSNSDSKPSGESNSTRVTKLVTKSFLISRFNVPPEVLLVALISSLNNLSSQILGVFGMQSKYRLINTGVWGLAFMSAFTWGFVKSSLDQGLDSGIFRYPTVCVVGFIPHTLILMGISLCASIYAFALLITMLSPPDSFPPNMTLRQRFWTAQENMQANVSLSTLKIDMKEDFYTSLLRTGITALTAASEAVYLNEGQRIKIGHWTWIEEEQMHEITRSGSEPKMSGDAAFRSKDSIPTANKTDVDSELLRGGYARERSTKALKVKNHRSVRENDGVGAHLRGARFMLAYNFFAGIFWLVIGWSAIFLFRALALFGIRRRPQWLSSLLVDPPLTAKAPPNQDSSPRELEFWILSDNGELALPRDDNIDVATETKRRLQMAERVWGPTQEEQLDSKLYSWFVHGGWWGERDDSDDYRQPATFPDDDTTSMVSFSTTATDDTDPGWSSTASGRATPTQDDYAPRSTRESSVSADLHLGPAQLARLLNPTDSESRDEARLLAAHLTSEHALTRAAYRKGGGAAAPRTAALTSTRFRPPGFQPAAPSGRLTREEEAELLEWLIVAYRAKGGRPVATAGTADWASGGDGMGAGGPLCVVCQTAPRTVLAWPCRCLSLCDDCRISLAMNNFGSCVCCRQEVVAFSRLYVP